MTILRVRPVWLALVCIAVVSVGGVHANASAAPAGKAKSSWHLLNSTELTVCSDTSYPPMESRSPNNPQQFVGADVELANVLAKHMGLKGAKIVPTNFDSIIPALEANRCDIVMSSMNDTPDRAKKVNFVDYMTASEGILVPMSSKIHANNYSGVCGDTVAVEKGTTELDGMMAADKSCHKKIDILSFTEDTGAFQAFAAGHAAAYTSDLPVIANYVHKFHGKYRMAGKAISAGENYGIAIRKNDPSLKSAIQKALHKVMANGQYKRILKKWGVADAALKKKK